MMIYGGHKRMLYLVSFLTVPQLQTLLLPLLSSAFIPLEKETGFGEFKRFVCFGFFIRTSNWNQYWLFARQFGYRRREQNTKKHYCHDDYCLLIHQVRSSTQNTYIFSFSLCLSDSRLPLCSKPSKFLCVPPPLPLPRILPLPLPRPLMGLSRSNLSIGLKTGNLVRFWLLQNS